MAPKEIRNEIRLKVFSAKYPFTWQVSREVFKLRKLKIEGRQIVTRIVYRQLIIVETILYVYTCRRWIIEVLLAEKS